MKIDKQILDDLDDIKRFCDFVIGKNEIGSHEIVYLEVLVKSLHYDVVNGNKKEQK